MNKETPMAPSQWKTESLSLFSEARLVKYWANFNSIIF